MTRRVAFRSMRASELALGLWKVLVILPMGSKVRAAILEDKSRVTETAELEILGGASSYVHTLLTIVLFLKISQSGSLGGRSCGVGSG